MFLLSTIIAQGISNPALPGNLGAPENSATTLGTYIAVLWQTLLILGAIALLINMLIAGMNWIMGGGEKGKVEEAKTRITQSIMGFAILAAVAAIAIFLSDPFGINLLKPTFPTLLDLQDSSTNTNNSEYPYSNQNAEEVPLE